MRSRDGETCGVTLVLMTTNSRMNDKTKGQNMVLLAPCPSRRTLSQCCNISVFGVL